MSSENKRIAARQPVLKSAKAHFKNAVVDCLILDVSPTGVRLSTDGFIAFPDELTIELRSGGMWAAAKRWQRGTETGFEFTRFAGLNPPATLEAAQILQDLRYAGIREVADRMINNRFFDHPGFRDAVEALERAVAELDKRLAAAIDK